MCKSSSLSSPKQSNLAHGAESITEIHKLDQLRILNESDPKSAEWINPLKVKVSSERLVQMNVKENIDALTTISSEYESWSVTHVNVMSSSQIKVKVNVLNHKFQVKAKQTY